MPGCGRVVEDVCDVPVHCVHFPTDLGSLVPCCAVCFLVQLYRMFASAVRGLPMSAFAALAHGSRCVRDNALAYVAMQPDVDADVLHLAAMWGNDLAKDEAIRHPNVTEDTLAMVARGDGPVGDNARRELERRRK